MPRDERRTPPCPPPAAATAAPAGDAAPEALEAALDGVRYALLRQDGAGWRLGSLSPLWREEAAALGVAPDAHALESLAARGVWLAPDAAAPPLAVMCCGLGSVWPGMGRELYDNFPAARAAMDRVAALADWDVLGLRDETDVEAISHSRRQIPYLFLLEYAQWSQFASLGLAPALFCGHSLGELIGLSLAGIYGLEEAWYILETRAGHMAELEARATRDTGMMAVHAESDVIDETLANWPDIYVSNRNTPRQFILSGPRQSLQAARAALRKRRIPSMLLNVSLAFHHPGMRILRDLSQRRLGALEMRAPRVPMLSGITAGHYPHDQPSICRYITDLDENTVIWTDCVDAMWRRDGIRHFLELGPQDTLCGLVADCEPRALCLSAGRKGNEVAAMRAACARLHALGHLSFPRICRLAAARRPADPAPEDAAPAAPDASVAPVAPVAGAAPDVPAEALFGRDTEQVSRILELVAESCGRPRAALRPEHDLRYDLALRSSRFPLLLQEAERRLGVRVEFEALLQVTTVGDLVRVLLGAGGGAASAPRERGRAVRRKALFPPLRRFALLEGGAPHGRPMPLPLDPGGTGPGVGPGGVYALCVLDAALLPELWSGLAAFSATLGVPRACAPACAPLVRAGSHLLPLELDAASGPEALTAALDGLRAAEGRLDGIFLVPPPASLATGAPAPQGSREDALAAACGAWRARHAENGVWFACLRRWRGTPAQTAAALAGEGDILAPVGGWMRAMGAAGAAPVLALLDDGRRPGRDALGDQCAAELFLGGGRSVLLTLAEAESAAGAPATARPAPERRPAPLIDRPELFAPVYPEPWAGSLPPLPPESGLFQGGCQFSRFADPALAEHGGRAPSGAAAWLPFSRALLALLQGARLLLPWLTVTGFSDVRFFAPPLLPPGITREGRVTARAQPWIMHDGAMTRMCRVALAIRELAANGRHTDTFAPVAEGMALLASGPREAPPLAPLPPLPGDGGRAAGADLALEPLYARLGFGPAWRMISRLRPVRCEAAGDVLAVHAGTLRAGMREAGTAGADASGMPGACPVAPRADWGYADALRLTAAAMESALLILEQEGGAPAAGHGEASSAGRPAWRCGGAGFIRFGSVPGNGAPAREDGRAGACRGESPGLEVRRTWDDGDRVRFDAQISGADGSVALTLHHLEFERPAV